MNDTTIPATSNATSMTAGPSYSITSIDQLVDKCGQMMERYWIENPELHRLVELKKKAAVETAATQPEVVPENSIQDTTITTETKLKSLALTELRGAQLRAEIRKGHRKIRACVLAAGADITPRTQAHNKKCTHETLEEAREFRADIVAAQIRSWRSLLPNLIRKFSRIPDYRCPGSTKHKMTVLMVFGLFAFIFRLNSRREMNRELTSPVIFVHLKKLFPEMESIPHADTLARLLKKINPHRIEAAHISLIKDLIKKKKFKRLLINGCLPITIDGTQKLYRDGLLEDSRWCERKVGKPEDDNKQQYIYAIEANITLQNGLTIPLMTEYLYRENNQLMQPTGKQDSETTAFERLAERLKQYFPRLKIIFFMDAMYATQHVMGMLHKNSWEYIIRLPKNKLTDFAKRLNKRKSMSVQTPGQPAYRKRKQEFYWENDIVYGYEWQLNIHLVACLERYDKVDKKTGKIVECFSERAWISSISININNVHELLNLGARKKELIEDSMNAEKNRGYKYKHAFSHNWNTMRGFHYLMRLGHAINAISEFTKELKRYVKELGCSATLKLIKETLFSPWLPPEWYAVQRLKTPQLRLQLE